MHKSEQGQSTEVTVDGTRDSGVADWTKTMHTSLSQKMVVRLQELSAGLPLCQRVDISLLKRVKGLPWDGQGLFRCGRTPKLVLTEPAMAETGETLRTGGSSSSGIQFFSD